MPSARPHELQIAVQSSAGGTGQYFFNLPDKKSQTDGANNLIWKVAA